MFANDVKPSNLPLVCGRARLDLAEVSLLVERERSITFAGTPRYLAPEIWHGRRHARTDQYALAITYYQMRTGRFPWVGDTPADVMRQHLEGTPDLTALSEAEQEPLRRALARAPEDRFDSCAALLRELWRSAVKVGALMDDGGEPSLTAVADPSWLRWNDGTVVRLGRAIDQSGAFERMPILADALEDAGCDNAAILAHCRGPGPHVRGCWVVDLLLGKE
jgi:serine/threonine protein kinase